MAQAEKTADEIADLAEIMKLVRSDTKALVRDLREGVGMWSHAGFLVLMIGLLSLFIGILTEGSGVIMLPTGLWHYAELAATFGLGVFGVAMYFYYRRRFILLREKYRALFEAAKNL